MEILNGLLNLVTNENKVVTQHYKLFDEVIQGETSIDTRINLWEHSLPLIIGYYSNDFYININQIKTASGVPSWAGNTSFRDYVIQYTLSKDFNILTDSINDFRWVTIASHSGATRDLITHDVNIQDAEAVRWIITRQNHGTYLDLVEFALYGELIPRHPKPIIDYIIYNTNQKSVGDTILISWGESDNATRYELQYYINNEWITINNNITNTEYVYTFEQPNPTAQFRVKGINENGESEWAVGGEFEVSYQSVVNSSIVLNSVNKMRGYIDIIGYGENDLNSSLIVKQFHGEELDSSLIISKKDQQNEFDSNLIVAQRDFSSLSSSVILNPSGRMRGFVDIVQPPKKVKKIYPIKDSVVRQSAPTINYGNSQQMLAGEVAEGKFISYLGFDLQLPDNIDIESIKLVLHKQYDTPRRFLMGLYETSDNWDEYDITWNFRPYDEEYVTQFPIPMDTGRVEADLTDFGWVEGKKSFIIRPRNYAFSELTAFGTRESLNPPYIEVIYYEIVENVNSYSIDSNIIVRRSSNRDISASIDVQSDYVYSELEGLLEINKKHDTEELKGTVLVAELRHMDFGGALEIEKKPQEIEIDLAMIVPYRTFLEASIDIERKDKENNLNSSIRIRAYEEENLASILNIESKGVDSDLGSSITIKRDSEEDLESTLIIENKHIDEELDSTITVGRTESEYLNSTLLLERKDKDTNIGSSIIVQRKESIDLDSSIEVPRYDEDIEIEGSLYILHRSNIRGSVEIPKTDSQDEIDVSIEIPQYVEETSIDSNINVRVFWVDELQSSINVERKFEIDGNLVIKKKDDKNELEAQMYVNIGGSYVFIM